MSRPWIAMRVACVLAFVLIAESASAVFPSRRISLDLRDAEVSDVIWALATEHGMNVVMGEGIGGRVTVTLRNVTVSTAFRSILDNAGLGYEVTGNVIRVNTLDKIKEKKTKEQLATRTVRLNYFTTGFKNSGGESGGGGGGGDDLSALAESLQAHLSGSAGASVTVIPRTNSVIITDISSNVYRLERMVRELDVPSPQVLIEARIFEIDPTYSRALGVQSFLNAQRVNGGTTAGAGVGANYGAPGVPVSSSTAGAFVGPGGAAANFLLQHLDGPDLTSLDVTLSAAETNGLAKMLAAPRVTTLNNKEAIISSGQRIPFTTLGSLQSQGGTNLVATIEFVDASLELAVTPYVTGDGKIIMKIRASRNSADFANTVFENPTINTRETINEVVIDDGDSVVIGGIFTEDETDSVAGVPVLKDIPAVGWLFKNTQRTKRTMELVFLVTATVLRDPGLIRASPDDPLGKNNPAASP